MSFLLGAVGEGALCLSSSGLARFRSITANHGGGAPRIWHGDGSALCHVQSVVTPEDRAERMPRLHAGDRSVLILDGWLSNRSEIVAALGLPPAETSGWPDSALVAAALDRWDEGACSYLRGSFAFADWDMDGRRLMLAASSTGGRPLYYRATGDGVLFSTGLHAVTALADAPPELDDGVLAQFMLRAFDRVVGRSVYRGIAMLPAAGLFVWRAGRMRTARYWRPDFSRRIRFARDDDYVEAARELLDRAVADSLRSVGPTVCHLSGGLDSSGVAATAARLVAPNPVQTVTLVPDPGEPLPEDPRWAYCDPWPHAAAVAAMYPNIVTHRAPSVLPSADEEDWIGPILRSGWPARHMFSIQKLDGYRPTVQTLGAKVLLNGNSGNATLSYDGRAGLPGQVMSGSVLGLARNLWGFWRHGRNPWSILLWHAVRPLVPQPIVERWRNIRGKPGRWRSESALNPAFGEWIGADSLWNDIDIADAEPGLGLEDRCRLFHLENLWLANTVQASGRPAEGYEQRDPLGDQRLIEFCLAIPGDQFLRNGTDRWLARRVLADRLPASVVGERRVDWLTPEYHGWMARRRPAILAELERLERSPAAARLLDIPRLKRIAAAEWPAAGTAIRRENFDLIVLGRGLRMGQFIRWAEGRND